jgi:hypothetical protein
MKYILDLIIFVLCFPLGGYIFGLISTYIGIFLSNLLGNKHLFLIILPFPLQLVFSGFTYIYLTMYFNNQIWFIPMTILLFLKLFQVYMNIFENQGLHPTFEQTLLGETEYSIIQKKNIESIRLYLMLLVNLILLLLIIFFY